MDTRARGRGTSDDESLDTVGPKLAYVPSPDLDGSRPVVAGGVDPFGALDFVWPEQLAPFEKLNAGLVGRPFEGVAVLGSSRFRRLRRDAWRPARPAFADDRRGTPFDPVARAFSRTSRAMASTVSSRGSGTGRKAEAIRPSRPARPSAAAPPRGAACRPPPTRS